MMLVTKDPNADLDYAIDWTAWLGDDTITQSTWTAPSDSGISIHNDSVDGTGKVCNVWLSGGTVSSTPYRVINQIVTTGGRRDERSLSIRIQLR